jgi:hypothetical protein
MLKYLKPYSDETLIGFVYRTSRENMMDNLSWIFQCINRDLSIKLTEHRVNWLKGEELEAIANYLGLHIDSARKLTVINDMEELGIEVRNVLKNQMFLYSKTRFCPLCLKESVYHRKTWISCHSIICIRHSLFLLDSCEVCGVIPTTRAIILDKCLKCNHKLSDSNYKNVNIDILISYQKLINEILLKRTFTYNHMWIDNSTVFLKCLDFLIHYIAFFINAKLLSKKELEVNYNGNIIERNHLKNYKTINQTICLYSFAFDIINNWPSRFHNFLDVAEKKDQKRFASLISLGIPKLIGTHLWNISRELTNYLAYFKFKLPKTEYIRSDEIKHLYLKFNGSIVNSKLFVTHKKYYKGVAFVLIDIKDLKKAIIKMDNCITKSELMKRWGTSSVSTFRILRAGILNDSFTFDSGSISKWIIPKASFSKLEHDLMSKTSTSIKNPISFHSACKWIGPNNADLLIKGMLNRRIEFIYNHKKFSQTVVNKRDCYYLIKKIVLEDSLNKGFISMRNLILILGVKSSDIIYWISTGRFGDIRTINEDLPYSNFLAFNKNYITTLELAFQKNIKISQLLTQYRMKKISAISGPEFNDGYRLLFYR